MRTDQPVTIRRLDYQVPAYLVDTVELDIALDSERTIVEAKLGIRRNPASTAPRMLVLDGEALEFILATLDGQPVTPVIADNRFTLADVPDSFTLVTVSANKPSANTTLSGLFMSKNGFFTQCEAEGFRRITYFPDRPDVMARYRVRLSADKARYPVLLGNGNLLEQGELPGGRHYAVWDDPFLKPSYLFALVAADLVCEEQTITTNTGRTALLQVWVENGDLDKTHHAMESLINSIRWDEQRFGLELDLDRFMIVAVSDFNMGAMENKGLNIFNTKFVLANPQVATDIDFANVESVVGHEYFHNWTGNRVTCRDWFQLSLKEGLTVFRDQEFSMDMIAAAAPNAAVAASGKAVKRIDDVRTLRAAQFPEDAGPMSHPIRPDEYQEINNFYTATVYEKGSEIIRMQQTILGRDGFRRGMDEYFRRHDGQAVTCDDFVAAMEAANAHLGETADLSLFRRWYSQSGTPVLSAEREWDGNTGRLTITLSQHTAPSVSQPVKLPLHIPVVIGLLGADGADLPLRLDGESGPAPTERVLHLKEAKQSFTFTGLPAGEAMPVPSLLRGFSAPVVLDHDLRVEELAFLMAHDSDAFNRWEAGQQLMLSVIHARLRGEDAGLQTSALVEAMHRTLEADLDPAFVEVALTLPDEAYIAETLDVVDAPAIARVRDELKRQVATGLEDSLRARYTALGVALAAAGEYRPDPASAGRRGLRNLCLRYLTEIEGDGLQLAREQYAAATNMTDRFAALTALAHAGAATAELADFFQRYENEALVLDKWFTLQSTAARVPDGSSQPFVLHVLGLLKHAAFNLRNPNRARSVILQFCMNNPRHFHADDGSGYQLWAEYVLRLDSLNPQIAARLARSMDRWRRHTPERQARMREALQRVADKPELSPDVREIVGKALGA
ncbi:aminopeptidase N [Derxia gummosa]|uniref:Aminopeptidase N n=1 Tax=Derxia gummosa DSM 723 TaxID=1121388 RepID=A0A8B6X0Y8_9BURK|nr:aminopeptidase N [Derxia gummosa]